MTWENRLIFEVSSADPDAAIPNWVDLTTRINDMLAPIEVNIGRQNDLDQSEPTNWALTLNNADDALTFGNPASPYAGWWGPGRKCRLREAVAGTIIALATGYLQVPTESVALAGIDQTVTVSIVDRLGRLAASQPFVSTLGEYIRHAPAAPQMIALWPMADASAQTQADLLGKSAPLAATTVIAGGGGQVAGNPAFTPNRAASQIWGDDLTVGLFAPVPGVASITAKWVEFVTSKPFQTADPTVTVSWWMYWDDPAAQSAPTVIELDGSPNILQIFYSVGVWKIFDGTTIFTVGNTVIPTSKKWTLVSVRWTATDLQWWQDTLPPVTFSHSVGNLNARGIIVGEAFAGSIGYVQIYDGAMFDQTAHLAQFAMAQTGLERQTTGDRIRTIAAYAGIPNGEYVNTVDSGCSVMQVARLAGRTPLEGMRIAETAEQGLLFVDGSGNLTFNDRRTLYNI